jgi:2-hydroxy-6-oxonona-2,4-dienedioate hydrolase
MSALETSKMNNHISIWSELAGVALKQYYVEAGGVRTRVLEAGQGPALIFVHGTGGHLEAYTRNFKELSQHFRMITYDMVGHGLSDKPDQPYTISVLTEHLVALMDALNVDRTFLSGESIGGWVAAWTAAHHADRVAKLILNTPGNITNKPEVMRRVKESSLQAVREATTESVRARLEWLFHDKSFVTAELISIRQAIYTQSGFLRAMENIVVMQDPEVRQHFVWGPAWCEKITAPTLLLWTDNDPTGALDEADLLKQWIPGSQLHVITDAGHWPQWEKPGEFNEVHRRFLMEGEV